MDVIDYLTVLKDMAITIMVAVTLIGIKEDKDHKLARWLFMVILFSL